MNIINSVKIIGLFGNSKPVDIKINAQFNFFIGPNGTGKTTIINLLAATLLADFTKLDRTSFSKIEVKLKEVNGKGRPSIVVEKILKPGLPFFDIKYTIRLFDGEKIEYDLDAYEEEVNLRGAPMRIMHERNRNYKMKLDIREQLNALVNARWLSVQRVNEEAKRNEDRKYISSVDQKLYDLNNDLVRFFSKIAKKFSEDTVEFQKDSFLKLLENPPTEQLFKFIRKINLKEEKVALEKIFEVLEVPADKYAILLKAHTENLQKATDSLAGNEGLSLDVLSSMYNASRAHSLIQSFNVLQEKKKRNFSPRDNFIQLLGVMFAPRKTVEITQKNELLFRNIDGTPIEPQSLSSGEKQLLIILGEALLQESEPVVYIADEPELSLHVRWQEQLTSAINFLNPAAQIIFATHSPDIVNVHSDKIVNMENILQ